jgi:hypothetical protein
VELGEALGAVAALEQERLAAATLASSAGQLARLAGEHERRVAGERVFVAASSAALSG